MRAGPLVGLSLALLAAACSGEDAPGAVSSTTISQVTGVIVEVDPPGVEDVERFVVDDGRDRYEIRVAPDVDYGFPLFHLNEHLATGDPVSVRLDTRDGDLFALSIVDA